MEEIKLPIIIEFMGAPGTGKTTISKSLKKKLEKEININIIEPTFNIENKSKFIRLFLKILQSVLFLILHPIKFFLLIKVVLNSNQKSFKDILIVTLNAIMIIMFYKHSSKTNNVSIYDQGFLQAIWAILYMSESDNYDWIDTLIDSLLPKYSKQIIVYINIDFEIFKTLPLRIDKIGRFESINNTNNNKFNFDNSRFKTNLIKRKINEKIKYKTDIVFLEITTYKDVKWLLDQILQEVTKT